MSTADNPGPLSTDEVLQFLRAAKDYPPTFKAEIERRFDQIDPNWRSFVVPSALLDLDQRSFDILVCLTKGMTNKEIAEELEIAESTAKNNSSTLFTLIGVCDRVNAVLWAHSMGLKLGEPRLERGGVNAGGN